MTKLESSADDQGDDLGQIHGPTVPPPREPDDKTLREQFDYEHKAHIAALKSHLEEIKGVLKDTKSERNRFRKEHDLQRKELDLLRPEHAIVKKDYQTLLEKNRTSDCLIAVGAACFGVNSFSFVTAKMGLFVAGLVFSGCGYYYKYLASRSRPNS